MHDRCSEVSPSTVNRDLTALKRLYGSAYEIELTDRHLLSGVKPFREFTKERRLLSFEEYLKLIECCAFVPHTDPFVLTLFVVVLGETGCRKSEALHLRRDDCDLTQNTAALNRVKGRRGHLVPMSGRLAQMLRAGKGTSGATSWQTQNSRVGVSWIPRGASGLPPGWGRRPLASDPRPASFPCLPVGARGCSNTDHPEAPGPPEPGDHTALSEAPGSLVRGGARGF